MFDKLVALFERLVIAHEKMAEAASAPAGVTTAQATNDTPVNTTSDKPDYAAISKQDNGREALLQMCKDRDIEIPKQTKTPTLVKKLEAWDLANPNGLQAPPETEPENPPEEDPFGEAEQPTEEDPFGEEENIAKEWQPEEVKAALQQYMVDQGGGEKGRKAVMDILHTHGDGAAKLKDLDASNYDSVMQAIQG